MNHIQALVLTALFILGAACGGKETPAESPQPVTGDDKTAPADPQASCEAMFAKARECTDDYLPALVDLRISLDLPPGIAQAAQTEGRAALIATAREEWATDSLPENATPACQNVISKMSAEDAASVTQRANACMAEDSCSRFTGCIMSLHEDMFRRAAAQQQPGQDQ